MAHKTLIAGTAYDISGGKTLVGGTAYGVSAGKTLIGGTTYGVNLVSYSPLADSTWAQIQYVAQNGLFSQTGWAIGDTKTTTLSTAVLGTSSFTMQLVGVDLDGANTLAFISLASSINTINIVGSFTGYASSLMSTNATNFYNYTDAKDYIKVLQRYYYTPGTTTRTAMSMPVFIPSLIEIGGTGSYYSNGDTGLTGTGHYSSFFNSDATRIKTYEGSSSTTRYWTRSTPRDIAGYAFLIGLSGTSEAKKTGNYRAIFGFVIG